MSVDTSLPVTNPKDDVDEYVRQYFSEYFSESHIVDENDFELVKSFFMNLSSKNIKLTFGIIYLVVLFIVLYFFYSCFII